MKYNGDGESAGEETTGEFENIITGVWYVKVRFELVQEYRVHAVNRGNVHTYKTLTMGPYTLFLLMFSSQMAFKTCVYV